MSDEPAARALALVQRLFALLHECRALVPQLEAAGAEPVSAQAERLPYYALIGALEAALTAGAAAGPDVKPGGAVQLARSCSRG